jgi:hypothetical protein
MVVAWIADVAANQGVSGAVVDGNSRDGLCRPRLHAGFERSEKQRGEVRKGMIGGVHRSAATGKGDGGPLLGRLWPCTGVELGHGGCGAGPTGLLSPFSFSPFFLFLFYFYILFLFTPCAPMHVYMCCHHIYIPVWSTKGHLGF